MDLEEKKERFDSNYRPLIYASYAHRDEERALPIIKQLQQRGLKVWHRGLIEAGSDWTTITEHTVKHCDIFISFISENMYGSRICEAELKCVNKRNSKIFFIYLENTKYFPFWLSRGDVRSDSYPLIRWYEYTDNDEFMRALIAKNGLEDCCSASDANCNCEESEIKKCTILYENYDSIDEYIEDHFDEMDAAEEISITIIASGGRYDPEFDGEVRLHALTNLENLTELVIYGNIVDLEYLNQFTNTMRYVKVHANRVKNVEELCLLTNLSYLELYADNLRDLRPLHCLKRLQSFKFSKNFWTSLQLRTIMRQLGMVERDLALDTDDYLFYDFEKRRAVCKKIYELICNQD